MKVHIVSGTPRRKPAVGDTKVIGGVLHVREFKRVRDRQGRPIGFDCTGGRQRYEWVPATPTNDASGEG